MIPVLTKEQAYKLDKDTIESGHLSQDQLMDNAGKAVAQFFCEKITNPFELISTRRHRCRVARLSSSGHLSRVMERPMQPQPVRVFGRAMSSPYLRFGREANILLAG